MTHDSDCFVRDGDAILMCASTEYHFGGGFGIVFGRRRFPRTGVEPIGGLGETLGDKERSSELLMVRARELNMVGEFMGQIVAQIRCGAWDSDDNRHRSWSVLGTVVEFPHSAQDGRRDAIPARRVRREEVLPGLGGEGPEISRHGGIELKFRNGVRAREHQDDGHNCRCNHGENKYTTHGTSLPTLGVSRRSRSRLSKRNGCDHRVTR